MANDELELAEDSTAHPATDVQPSLTSLPPPEDDGLSSRLPNDDQEETDESQTKTKRAVSKHEHEEFVDLFGEASDEEVLDESGDAAGVTVRSADTDSDDDDVVEVMVEEKEHEPVIDLTAETSSDEEYVTAGQFDTMDTTAAVAHSVSQVSIKKEKSHDKEIKNDKKSKHRSKHKQSTKDKCDKQSSSKEKNSERQSKSSSSDSGGSHRQASHRSSSAVGLPVVSATSEADQCKELFEMFQRCEQPVETLNSAIQVPLSDLIRPTCHGRKSRC